MSRTRFEVFQYRRVLQRLRRQGDSDRIIARSGPMGRPKVAMFRLLADAQDWLKREAPLPDDAAIAAVLCAPPCQQHHFKRRIISHTSRALGRTRCRWRGDPRGAVARAWISRQLLIGAADAR